MRLTVRARREVQRAPVRAECARSPDLSGPNENAKQNLASDSGSLLLFSSSTRFSSPLPQNPLPFPPLARTARSFAQPAHHSYLLTLSALALINKNQPAPRRPLNNYPSPTHKDALPCLARRCALLDGRSGVHLHCVRWGSRSVPPFALRVPSKQAADLRRLGTLVFLQRSWTGRGHWSCRCWVRPVAVSVSCDHHERSCPSQCG